MDSHSDNNQSIIPSFDNLYSMHTFGLIILSIVTLGLFNLYVITKQNSSLIETAGYNPNPLILPAYITLIIAGVVFTLMTINEATLPDISQFSGIISFAVSVWYAFSIKNFVNNKFSFSEDHPHRFSALWAFVFSYIYINYKIRDNIQNPIDDITIENSDVS
jgi:hypothetical protein